MSANEETLIPCEATTEDDFVTSEIMVGIKSAYSVVNKVWTASDFPELSGITTIEDLTYADTQEAVTQFSSKDNFHQLLKIAISSTSKSAVIAGIEALEQNDKLLFAEPNFIIELEEPVIPQDNGVALANNLSLTNTNRYQKYTNDPKLLEQDGIFLHNVDKVWNAFTTGSSNVVVGVIDTGIYGHLDMSANLSLGYNCTDGVNETSYFDAIGHGTSVASIIGAKGNNSRGMTGVCQDITLYSLRVYNTAGTITDGAIAQAFLKAEANNIPIINISMGGYGYNSLIETTMGMYSGLIVCAAGNDGQEITDNNPYYSPCYDVDNMISVGSIDSTKTISSFSNYSSTYIDIMAYGEDMIVCKKGGGYTTKSDEYYGTSFSAPFVAGVAALLLSYDNTLTAAQLKLYILNGAKTSPDLTDYCVDGRYLDAYGAFLAMKGQRATCINLRVGQYDNSLEYNFTVNYNPTYAKLSEIVIPNVVQEQMLSGSTITFTSTSITVHLDLGYVLEFGDDPIIEFHFISYSTPAYAKAHVGLTTNSVVDFDGITQTNIVIPSKKLLVGDANGNGSVNITDSQLIMQYISDPRKITGDNLLAADVNSDSLVNSVDSLRISNYSVSKLYSFF